MSEEWKPVVGYEGLYDVSSLGRVRSYVFSRWGLKGQQPKLLKPCNSGNWGYYVVGLRKDGKTKNHYVHHLVTEAFQGPRPAGMLARHSNDMRTDNRSSNLSWGTKSDNAKDAVKNRRLPIGERSKHSKLTEQAVRAIRLSLSEGIKQSKIARTYGIHPSCVSRIATGDNWKHVE